MSRIIKQIIAVWLAMVAFSSFAEDAPSFKISLAIRDNSYVTLKRVEYPLAFRIENTGKAAIGMDDIPTLFFRGIIHLLPKGGKEQQTRVQEEWRTMVYDLQPGAVFESPVYGDVLSFFPSSKDGAYEVWWTLGELKSNSLHFTVTGGKLSQDVPKT